MEIAVLTCNSHAWLLLGFGYFIKKYWDNHPPVTIYAPLKPSFYAKGMPKNFYFKELPREYPVYMWTDSVSAMIDLIRDEYFIFMLEDYWLTDPVNGKAVKSLERYMRELKDDILRIDLTRDRASTKHKIIGRINGLTLVETLPKSKYQMSFQAAIWDKYLLQKQLFLGETPWQAEIMGSERMSAEPHIRVLGTLDSPLKYKPVFRTKKRQLNLGLLPPGDRLEVEIIYEKFGFDFHASKEMQADRKT